MAGDTLMKQAVKRHLRESASREVPRILAWSGAASLGGSVLINLTVPATTALRYVVEGLAVVLLFVLGWATGQGRPLGQKASEVFTGAVVALVGVVLALMVVNPTIINAAVVIMIMTTFGTIVLRWGLFAIAASVMLLCSAVATPRLPPSWESRWMVVSLMALGLSALLLATRRRTVDDVVEAELALQRAARTDALTALRNRYGFTEAAQALLDQADGVGGEVYAAFIDIDGLKDVNDAYGHDAGDRAIVAVARALTAQVDPGTVVARLGGDEFVVVGHGIVPDADAMSRAVWAAVIDGADPHTLPGGVSVGTSQATDSSLEGLLKLADQHMYRRRALRRTEGSAG